MDNTAYSMHILHLSTEILQHIKMILFRDGLPTASTVDLLNENYEIAGELLVMSILQGGPAPCFMEHCLYQFIAKLPIPTRDLPSEWKLFAEKVKQYFIQYYCR